ncbi:DarT ssDNA thymidine ADP-ribosyltransferase family protein [Catenulispora rubra]|uniref:DarT ssDNA thymidine ADP-ribosyltransferase family protein n=1 Tax=Catenulispora rubra TaxID=280293 RepID=UPI0018922D10|nr:DarT ssDNA thymidine ADP-ribosyltransferase family protein [Catenulispora rubra]
MNDIVRRAHDRGLTRLCHFTRAVNLPHILVTGEIRSTSQLAVGTESFRNTDDKRLDGRRHQISCSLEYPNAWYLDTARRADHNFPNWIVMALDLDLMTATGVDFCPVNSARSNGNRIADGSLESFEAMFAPSVIGNGTRTRQPGHPDWWPTDDQAEVMLADAVPVAKIQRIIVEDDDQAALLLFQLSRQGLETLIPPLFTAPDLFDKRRLSKSLRAGIRPEERGYTSSPHLAE